MYCTYSVCIYVWSNTVQQATVVCGVPRTVIVCVFEFDLRMESIIAEL